MKIPGIFIPERDLEKKTEQLLQGGDDFVFEFEDKLFKDLVQIIQDKVIDQSDREKYFKELKSAKALYREEIKKMFNKGIDYQKIS